jgi:hypothetical protein
LALDRFTNPPGVTQIETSIIFDSRRRHELPVFLPLLVNTLNVNIPMDGAP